MQPLPFSFFNAASEEPTLVMLGLEGAVGQSHKRAPFDVTSYSAGAAPELDPALNFGETLL